MQAAHLASEVAYRMVVPGGEVCFVCVCVCVCGLEIGLFLFTALLPTEPCID